MEDNIFDDLEMIMSDRISIAYSKNEQYQKAISEEKELYERLKNILTEQQQELLQLYFESISATTAICEKVSYIQGIRDFVKILYHE